MKHVAAVGFRTAVEINEPAGARRLTHGVHAGEIRLVADQERSADADVITPALWAGAILGSGEACSLGTGHGRSIPRDRRDHAMSVTHVCRKSYPHDILERHHSRKPERLHKRFARLLGWFRKRMVVGTVEPVLVGRPALIECDLLAVRRS